MICTVPLQQNFDLPPGSVPATNSSEAFVQLARRGDNLLYDSASAN